MASFNSTLANDIGKPLCKFLLEQLNKGLEIRRAQVKEPETYKDVTELNVLTQAIFRQTVHDDAGTTDFSDLDYAVFFTVHLIHALSDIKNSVLNKTNPAFTQIYYNIFENVFTLGLKDEAEQPITSAESLTEVHLGWLKKLESQSW